MRCRMHGAISESMNPRSGNHERPFTIHRWPPVEHSGVADPPLIAAALLERLRPASGTNHPHQGTQAEPNTSVNVASAAWATGLLRVPDRSRSQLMEEPKAAGISRIEPATTANEAS